MQLINMNAQQQLASKDAMIQSIQGTRYHSVSLFLSLSLFFYVIQGLEFSRLQN